MNTPTPTPITAAHLALVRDMAAQGQYLSRSIEHYAQEIADSEARATAALRAEVERLRSDRDCEKRLRKDAEELREDAIERAERAEAELATERARLDWLESDAGVDWQWSDAARTVSRASIDAFMKEETK